MLAYIIRRLVYLIPVLFVLTVVVFTFVQMLPGDIIDVMMGEEDIEDPEVRAALEEEFGLNDPIYVQYGKWIGRVLQGDLGKSLITRRDVTLELFERIPATAYLAIDDDSPAGVISFAGGMRIYALRVSVSEYRFKCEVNNAATSVTVDTTDYPTGEWIATGVTEGDLQRVEVIWDDGTGGMGGGGDGVGVVAGGAALPWAVFIHRWCRQWTRVRVVASGRSSATTLVSRVRGRSTLVWLPTGVWIRAVWPWWR